MSWLQFPDAPESISPTSATGGSLLDICTPEVAKVKEMIRTVKGDVGTLNKSIDVIGNQAAQIALLGGELETAQELATLLQQMQAQEAKQNEGLQEIKRLLEEVLKGQMEAYLKMRVEDEVKAQIEEEVKQQVKAQLKTHVPKELQDDVASSQQRLQNVQRDLFNSESRRANAKLRSASSNNRLHTILMSNSEVHKLYPKDLAGLFALEATKCKQLMKDYGMQDVSNERDQNLNRFIEFCGVSYKMINRKPYRKLSIKDEFIT